MILTKEEFIDFFLNYKKFSDSIDQIDKVLGGCMWESNWCNAVGLMVDTFIYSHFTDKGSDLIQGFLFDNLDGWGLTIYENVSPNLFNKEEKEKCIEINTLDELWDYITKSGNKEIYCK